MRNNSRDDIWYCNCNCNSNCTSRGSRKCQDIFKCFNSMFFIFVLLRINFLPSIIKLKTLFSAACGNGCGTKWSVLKWSERSRVREVGFGLGYIYNVWTCTAMHENFREWTKYCIGMPQYVLIAFSYPTAYILKT